MRRPVRADLRSTLYAFLGALGGAIFVAFDLLSETRLRSGTLHGFLSQAHALIDHTLPIIVVTHLTDSGLSGTRLRF
jgi:ABC-type transporter Mla maintaining outer membrane lipid asymmetry permease subunit MlaE